MSRTSAWHTHAILILIAVLFSLLFVAPIPTANGAWGVNGTPVCTAPNDQSQLQSAPDGLGGKVSAWFDWRNTSFKVYVQRLDGQGNPLWTTDGVEVDPARAGQSHPDICGDGAGGAWVVWQQGVISPTSVYLQHFDASGNPDWGPPGGTAIGVGGVSDDHLRPVCVSNGNGGVYVAWIQGHFTSNYNVRAQWVTAGGTLRWGASGVQIGNEIGPSEELDVVNDVDAGCFVTWRDSPGWGRVQRVDYGGNPDWGTNGHNVSGTTVGSRVRVADRDRVSGGAYILYRWHHSGPPFDFDAFSIACVDSNLYPFWEEVIDSSELTGEEPGDDGRILPDGQGGCIAVWDEYDSVGSPNGVYAQRLDRDGDKQWGTRRRVSEIEAGNSLPEFVVEYGSWTSLVTWVGDDAGTPRVKYRKLDRSGGLWLSDEILVPGGYSSERPTIVAEPTGVANPIIAWIDERTGTQTDIYATGLTSGGDPIAPNLVVNSITFADNPGEVGVITQATIVAENIGTASSGAFELAFYHDLSSPPSVGQLPNGPIFPHAGLDPGETVTFQSDILSLVETTFRTYAFVDYTDLVEEFAHDDDNILGPVDLPWVARPNLRITQLSVSDADPRVGDMVTATIIVENDGHYMSPGVDLDFYLDQAIAPGVGIPGDQTKRVGPLPPGATYTWVTNAFTSAEIGQWMLWAQIDTQEESTEWKEDDNVFGPRSVEWHVPLQEGWPITVAGQLTSPAVGPVRLSQNGKRDIVVASGAGAVYAWDAYGTALPGWPHLMLTPTTIRSSVALGDVTEDANLETVFGADDGNLYCLARDGKKLWQYAMGGPVSATAALVDLDGDYHLEIVAGSESGVLVVLDGAGSPLPGWPITMDPGLGFYASPAVGQMDGLGVPEIVAIASSRLTKAPHGEIHVLKRNGTSYGVPWPLTSPRIIGSPSLGDIFGDAKLEIVVGDLDGDLHAIDLTGGTTTGFPKTLAGFIPTSPALWDSDGDGDLEIAVNTEELVSGLPSFIRMHQYLVSDRGTVLPNWPVTFGSPFLPSGVAQGPVAWGQDKDGYLALGSTRGECYTVAENATRPAGHGMSVNAPITGKVAVGDLDLDLHMEVVVAGNGEICVFDLMEGSYAPHLLEWPMFRHDMYRTGVYGFESVTGVEPDPPALPVTRTRLHPAYPNPFNPSVTIPFTLAWPGEISIVVYDLAGRRVRELLREHREGGTDFTTWNGRDTAGVGIGSGVYVVKLTAAGVTDEIRVTLLR